MSLNKVRCSTKNKLHDGIRYMLAYVVNYILRFPVVFPYGCWLILIVIGNSPLNI